METAPLLITYPALVVGRQPFSLIGTQPREGILILCLSHWQSFGLFLTKYIFASDLPFFLNFGNPALSSKNLAKAVCALFTDCVTAFE